MKIAFKRIRIRVIVLCNSFQCGFHCSVVHLVLKGAARTDLSGSGIWVQIFDTVSVCSACQDPTGGHSGCLRSILEASGSDNHSSSSSEMESR